MRHSLMTEAAGPTTGFSIDPEPAWVARRAVDWDFPAQPDDHAVFLLNDTQYSPSRGVTYERHLRRVLTPEAVQRLGQIEITYDPELHRLAVHEAGLWRDGFFKTFADPARFHLRQREAELENQILHGRVSAILILDDLRAGDVTEVRYSLHEVRRLPGRKLEFFFALRAPLRTAAWHTAVWLPRDEPEPGMWTADGRSLEPEVTETGQERIWSWSGREETNFEEESCTPPWFAALPYAQLSSYRSWEEAALLMAGHWDESAGEDSGELDELIASVVDSSRPLEDQALSLLRWVQENIRYLGVSGGLAGVVPSAPPEVLRRRYGDCKDKSLLLCCLFRKLGLVADPVLVHTEWRQAVGRHLPGLNSFNHAIVGFSCNGWQGFADPTGLSDGGRLFGQALPDYLLGLRLSPTEPGLVHLPPAPPGQSGWFVQEEIHVSADGATAVMDQCIEGTGFEANLLRSRLAQVGRDGFAKAEATDLRRFFADAQPDPAVSVSVSDERDANRLTVRARYLLQPWSETGSEEPQTFRYSPRWLLQFLQCPDTTSRRFPFGLRHPTDVVQLLRVHGNFRNVPPEDHPLEARWFQSRVVVDPRQSRSLIEFRYEYRSGTKTVEAADCGSYSREFRAMADKMGCVLEWMPGGRESAVFSHSVAASPPTGGRRGMAPPALPPASHRRGVSRRHRSEGKKLLPIWAWILAGLALLFVGLPAALIVGLAVLQATSSPASVNIPGPQDLALEDPRPAQIAASLQAGNRERALELILGLERDYPRHAETDLARARYHMRTGETREALAYTERLLRRLPDHPLPRHLQANIMVTANHPDTGRTVETLVRDFPNSAEAWGLSALWNYRQHRLPDSETAWRKAVEFAPDNPDILRDALAFLIAYRGLPEAVALARQCAERAPGSPFIQFFFATVLVEAGDFAGALAAVDKALALDPGNPVFLARKAGVLEALGQPEASATTEKLALELGAEVFEVQWDLGCTANRRGRWDDAERLLRKAVALRPDSADALNALGYTLLEKGEWSEARSHLEAAVRLHPLLETAWENLVILSAKEGNKTKEDEAREQLDRLRRELKLPP